MALFKKTEEKKKAASPKIEKVTEAKMESAAVSSADAKKNRGLALDEVLRRPHITERATELSERGVYAFEVHPKATKAEVKEAVRKFYKVTPLRVATINRPAKYTKSRTTNRTVVKTHAMRKALVTLKAGEKIEFV